MCHFADDNIGLFVILGEERGKENNRCEDQNILNLLGGNTVSISFPKGSSHPSMNEA